MGLGMTGYLGHHARADGRWRIYAFADADGSAIAQWAEWLERGADSSLVRFTPSGTQADAVFDVKVIYRGAHSEIDLADVPSVFVPRVGPYELIDYEKVYAADPGDDIFDARGIDRRGAVVVVRPDQYVAHVLPFEAQEELTRFFSNIMLDREQHMIGDPGWLPGPVSMSPSGFAAA